MSRDGKMRVVRLEVQTFAAVKVPICLGWRLWRSSNVLNVDGKKFQHMSDSCLNKQWFWSG